MPKGHYKHKCSKEILQIEANLICVQCKKHYKIPRGRGLEYLKSRKFCSLKCYRKSGNSKVGQFKKGHNTPQPKGKNAYSWKGGKTPENETARRGIEFDKWRKKVFEQDNYICQKCKVNNNRLHPHHIKNFSQCKKQRYDVNNGITFCKKCHLKFHNKYGYQNNNKQQVLDFLGLVGNKR